MTKPNSSMNSSSSSPNTSMKAGGPGGLKGKNLNSSRNFDIEIEVDDVQIEEESRPVREKAGTLDRGDSSGVVLKKPSAELEV